MFKDSLYINKAGIITCNDVFFVTLLALLILISLHSHTSVLRALIVGPHTMTLFIGRQLCPA